MRATSGGNTTGIKFNGQNVRPGSASVEEASLFGGDVRGVLVEGSVSVVVEGVSLEVIGEGTIEGEVVDGIAIVSPLITATDATLSLSHYNLTATSSLTTIHIVPEVTSNDISITTSSITVQSLILNTPSSVIALYIATEGDIILSSTSLTVEDLSLATNGEVSAIYISGGSVAVPAAGTNGEWLVNDFTASTSGDIYGMKIEAQTSISLLNSDLVVSNSQFTSSSGFVSGFLFLGGSSLTLQDGSANVTSTTLEGGNETSGISLTFDSITTSFFPLIVTSSSLNSLLADTKAVKLQATTTASLSGEMILDYTQISSSTGDVFGVDAFTGGALSFLGNTAWSTSIGGMTALNGNAFIVRGVSPAAITVETPLLMNISATVLASGKVTGYHFSSGTILTARGAIVISGVQLESTGEKVTGVDMFGSSLELGDLSEIFWGFESVSLIGAGDADGFLINATSIPSFQYLNFEIDDSSLSSNSGGLVRGVVWDCGSDFTTTFVGVRLVDSQFFSSGNVQGWVLESDVVWTAREGVFAMQGSRFEGTFATHGFYFSLKSFLGLNSDVQVEQTTFETLGNLDSNIFVIQSSQNIQMTGENTTFTYLNVTGIFNDPSPSSNALPLSWLSLSADSITMEGNFLARKSSLTSNNHCVGFHFLSSTLFSWPNVGQFGFADESTIVCAGNVTGVMVTSGAGGLSVSGLFEDQVFVRAEGSLMSTGGEVVGVLFGVEGGDLELEEVAFLNDYEYEAATDVTGVYLSAPGQLISYKNLDDIEGG